MFLVSKKAFFGPKLQTFMSKFSSKAFTVLALNIKSVVHVELIFAYDEKKGCNFMLLYADI